MYKDEELTIRLIEEKDLPKFWGLIYEENEPKWKNRMPLIFHINLNLLKNL